MTPSHRQNFALEAAGGCQSPQFGVRAHHEALQWVCIGSLISAKPAFFTGGEK